MLFQYLYVRACVWSALSWLLKCKHFGQKQDQIVGECIMHVREATTREQATESEYILKQNMFIPRFAVSTINIILFMHVRHTTIPTSYIVINL